MTYHESKKLGYDTYQQRLFVFSHNGTKIKIPRGKDRVEMENESGLRNKIGMENESKCIDVDGEVAFNLTLSHRHPYKNRHKLVHENYS